MLPVKFESPPYTAVTCFVPAASVDVEKVAVPPLNVPVPSVVLPCLNVTVSPLGGAPMLEVTFAVKVTACPYLDGFGDEVSMVVVAARTN